MMLVINPSPFPSLSPSPSRLLFAQRDFRPSQRHYSTSLSLLHAMAQAEAEAEAVRRQQQQRKRLWLAVREQEQQQREQQRQRLMRLRLMQQLEQQAEAQKRLRLRESQKQLALEQFLIQQQQQKQQQQRVQQQRQLEQERLRVHYLERAMFDDAVEKFFTVLLTGEKDQSENKHEVNDKISDSPDNKEALKSPQPEAFAQESINELTNKSSVAAKDDCLLNSTKSTDDCDQMNQLSGESVQEEEVTEPEPIQFHDIYDCSDSLQPVGSQESSSEVTVEDVEDGDDDYVLIH